MTKGSNGHTPDDPKALDALVDAGFSIGEVPSRLRGRATAVLDSLAAIDIEAPCNTALVDSTVALIDAASPMLDTDEARALDGLVEGGWDAAKVDARCEFAARRLAATLSVLDTPTKWEQEATVSRAAESLVDRTCALIEQLEAREARLQSQACEAMVVPRRRFGLRDVFAVASVLLIGSAILWPLLGMQRIDAQRAGCESNMMTAGIGFAQYAGDHGGALPIAETCALCGAAHKPGAHGHRCNESHSANLFRLVRDGYVPMGALACPGNAFAPVREPAADQRDWNSDKEVSYSYRQFGNGGPVRLYAVSGRRVKRVFVLLADKSPVVERMQRGERVDPNLNSSNHSRTGQHVLFSDLSIRWLGRPVLASGDNLWLPKAAKGAIKRSKETADDLGDAFVGH